MPSLTITLPDAAFSGTKMLTAGAEASPFPRPSWRDAGTAAPRGHTDFAGAVGHAVQLMSANDYGGEWYLPVDDGPHHLYVLERGTGPPVLAVHGGPGHDHGYLLDALAGIESRHRVVYFDQRGSLRSPIPIDNVTFEAVVDDIPTLVGELGGGPAPVVAHSMGCVVTAAALARHPDLFSHVVLVNPGPLKSGQGMPPAADARPEVGEELARAGISGRPRTAKEATWAWRIQFAGVNLFHVDRWRQVAGGRVFYKAEVAKAVWSTMPSDYDYVGSLRRHPYPVTIVVGDHDCVDPGARHAEGAAGGAVRTVVLPDAGHAAWIDQPERFREAVERGLGG